MFAPANKFDMPAATAKASHASSNRRYRFGRSPVADCTEFNEASVCAGSLRGP